MKYLFFFSLVLISGCIKDYDLGPVNYYTLPKVSPTLIERAHYFASSNISPDCSVLYDDSTITFWYYTNDIKSDSAKYRRQKIDNLAIHCGIALFYDYSTDEKELCGIKIIFWPFFAPDYTTYYCFPYSLDDPVFKIPIPK